MKVEWTMFEPGDVVPPMGLYWVIATYRQFKPQIQIAEVVYSKPKNIFRTDEYGGLDEDQVLYYAKFEFPEPPQGVPCVRI